MNRAIFLHDIPLEQAKERFQNELISHNLWQLLAEESIKLDECCVGRVLSRSIFARISSPNFHAAAMDGFAVHSEQTIGALPGNPIELVLKEQFGYVDTGDPLPERANAVIPIEQVECFDEDHRKAIDPRKPQTILIRAAVTPWSHVRTMGEDMVATQLVLPSGSLLRPFDLGAIAACGHSQIYVARKPMVGIIPTGSELVEIGRDPRKGDLIEFNSIVLSGQVGQWGGIAKRYPIVPDDLARIEQAILRAANENDLVLLNAGSSAGSEDFSVQAIENLGKVLVHGIAIRPGHPVIFGIIDGKGRSGKTEKHVPIIGVPGYPVSAALTGEIFVEPLLRTWLGLRPSHPVEIEARLTRKISSPAGDDDYVRVIVGEVRGTTLAAPIARGAGVISSLVHADGITVIPRGTQGIEAGESIKVHLMRPVEQIRNTLFAIGSHDMTLDIMAQFLEGFQRRLVSANVGSLGGLLAIQRGEAHIAGTHLLDSQTGRYNESFIRQYVPGQKVMLMHWAEREQGLIVQKGNPKAIKSLKDLQKDNVRYINRQRAAGTRVLLDFELKKAGIEPSFIKGYDQEEFTHLAVAAAVASGRADCGLGITSAASALGLDFIPLYSEQYDFVIPMDIFESALIAPFLELVKDIKFRTAIQDLPGYTFDRIGQIVPIE
jgi:putative molybdopterin biosynthesis protein